MRMLGMKCITTSPTDNGGRTGVVMGVDFEDEGGGMARRRRKNRKYTNNNGNEYNQYDEPHTLPSLPNFFHEHPPSGPSWFPAH